MELVSQGPLRCYRIPTVGEVSKIVVYGNGEQLYVRDQGWLEHYADKDGNPTRQSADVRAVVLPNDPKRAVKINLNRTDCYYLKDSAAFNRTTYALYVPGTVESLGTIELDRDRYNIQLGQFVRLSVQGRVKTWDRDYGPDEGPAAAAEGRLSELRQIVCRTKWQTVETDESKIVTALVAELAEAGIEVGHTTAGRLRDFYDLRRKDLTECRKRVAQEVYAKISKVATDGGEVVYPTEETDWSYNGNRVSRSYQAEDLMTGKKLGVCGFTVVFEGDGLKVAGVEQTGPRK